MTRKNDLDEAVKALVRAEVERALNPGMVDGHMSRRVSVTDPDGTRWRGFVWRVDPHEPLPEEREQLT